MLSFQPASRPPLAWQRVELKRSAATAARGKRESCQTMAPKQEQARPPSGAFDDDNKAVWSCGGACLDSERLPQVGWHYLSDATCLIRPHSFYACFVVPRVIICYIICHV